MTRASLIEAAARRMFVRMAYNPEEDVSPWEDQPHETRQWYRDFAEAAFAFPPGEAWIAPVNPSEAMAEAGDEAAADMQRTNHGQGAITIWHAMRDAISRRQEIIPKPKQSKALRR